MATSIIEKYGKINLDDLTAAEFMQHLRETGFNENVGLPDVDKLDMNEEDALFWSKFRGDFIDLRDYLLADTISAKKDVLKDWNKQRVTLVREHILNIWTYNKQLRQDLEKELEMINMIIYGYADENEN